MAKSDIKDFVCVPFCSFYREGAKEELICNGARVVEILLKRGVLSPERLTAMKGRPCPAVRREPALEAKVCGECPFRAEDCDFQSATPPPNARPCGGFILLSLLMVDGALIPTGLTGIADD